VLCLQTVKTGRTRKEKETLRKRNIYVEKNIQRIYSF
jgi:hypothetical protein